MATRRDRPRRWTVLLVFGILLALYGGTVAAIIGPDDSVRIGELTVDERARGAAVVTHPAVTAFTGLDIQYEASAPGGVFLASSHRVDTTSLLDERIRYEVSQLRWGHVGGWMREGNKKASFARTRPDRIIGWHQVADSMPAPNTLTDEDALPETAEIVVELDGTPIDIVAIPRSKDALVTVAVGAHVERVFFLHVALIGFGAVLGLAWWVLNLRRRRREARARRESEATAAAATSDVASAFPRPEAGTAPGTAPGGVGPGRPTPENPYGGTVSGSTLPSIYTTAPPAPEASEPSVAPETAPETAPEPGTSPEPDANPADVAEAIEATEPVEAAPAPPAPPRAERTDAPAAPPVATPPQVTPPVTPARTRRRPDDPDGPLPHYVTLPILGALLLCLALSGCSLPAAAPKTGHAPERVAITPSEASAVTGREIETVYAPSFAKYPMWSVAQVPAADGGGKVKLFLMERASFARPWRVRGKVGVATDPPAPALGDGYASKLVRRNAADAADAVARWWGSGDGSGLRPRTSVRKARKAFYATPGTSGAWVLPTSDSPVRVIRVAEGHLVLTQHDIGSRAGTHRVTSAMLLPPKGRPEVIGSTVVELR